MIDKPAATLTPREHEIAGMVSEGVANKKISSSLGISVETVKRHLVNIFDKLGCSNRTEMSWMYRHQHGNRYAGYICGLCGRPTLTMDAACEQRTITIRSRLGDGDTFFGVCPLCVGAVVGVIADIKKIRGVPA